jgi:small subunit ribosomal protein S15
MLTPEEKIKIIEKHRVHDTDSGSDEVQISLLSEEIDRLVSHLKKNPKDVHSKRGLLGMVSKRRKLLKHLKSENESGYAKIIKTIGIKK